MKKKMIRTNNTELSDDELIIFDLLFDSFISVDGLKKGDNITVGFNYPISHNFEVIDLKNVITKFIDMGLMKLKLDILPINDKIYATVGLTRIGGELWEKERLPIWDKYVTDSAFEENGTWQLSVFSTSLKTAKHFIDIAQKSNLYNFANKNDYELIENKEITLIPWKSFSKIYEIRAKLTKSMFTGNHPVTDWNLYKSKISWWRNTVELQDLHCKQRGSGKRRYL